MKGISVGGSLLLATILVRIGVLGSGNEDAGLPQLYNCIDWECEEWISKGKTLIVYTGRTDKHLSFKKNEDVLIVGKPIGSSTDWIAKIGKRTGLVPKEMIGEEEMRKVTPNFKVSLGELWATLKGSDQVENVGNLEEALPADGGKGTPSPQRVDDRPQLPQAAFEQTLKPTAVDISPPFPPTTFQYLEAPSPDAQQVDATPSSTLLPFENVQTPDPHSADEAVEKEVVAVGNGTSPSHIIQADISEASEPGQVVNATPPLPQTATVFQSAKTATNANVPPSASETAYENELTPESEVVDATPPTTQISVEALQTPDPQLSSSDNKSKADLNVEKFSTIQSEIAAKSEDPPPTEVGEASKLAESITEESDKSDIDDASLPSEASIEIFHNSEPSPIPLEDMRNASQNETSTLFGNDAVSSLEEISPLPTPPIQTFKMEASNSQPEKIIMSNIPPERKPALDAEVDVVPVKSNDQTDLDTIPEAVAEKQEKQKELIEISQSSPQAESSAQIVPLPQFSSTTPSPESQSREESIVQVDSGTEDGPSHSASHSEIDESQGKPVQVAQVEEPRETLPASSSSQPSASSQNIFFNQDHAQDKKEIAMETLTEQPDAATTPQTPTFVSVPIEDVDSPFIAGESKEEKAVDGLREETANDSPTIEVSSADSHVHHHHQNHFKEVDDSETSSIILVTKHISSTLLRFLPEPLQDTILDVDDALVLMGIIALTLISICVPYFFIEGYLSVRPLKKKVVELNKSLWKVSAAYETQQEEFEVFKQKAMAHDDFKRRAEQSENDVVILKSLDIKHREQITKLRGQLKSQMKEAVDIKALIEQSLEGKKVVEAECEKYKAAYESLKESFRLAKEELNTIQTHAKSSAIQLTVSGRNAEVLNSKIKLLQEEAEEMKEQLAREVEKRELVEKSKWEIAEAKAEVEKEVTSCKSICLQYELRVNELNGELEKVEGELAAIKESLGEDSPLLELAEIQAKALFSEREAESLRTRLDGLVADNDNLTGKVERLSGELANALLEEEKTRKRLIVLEKYFKEQEDNYIKKIEDLELKENVRDKGKDKLIIIIDERERTCKELSESVESLKEELEEMRQQHKTEVRTLEAKIHDSWLSLCQAERKAEDARKEGKLLRQRLTAMTKDRDEADEDGLNGMDDYPILPDELVPLPIMEEASYFDFVPPPPLPDDSEREHRPPPLGGRLSPQFPDFRGDHLSPIHASCGQDTDGSSGSNSPSGWETNERVAEGRDVRIPATSSPIQRGANL